MTVCVSHRGLICISFVLCTYNYLSYNWGWYQFQLKLQKEKIYIFIMYSYDQKNWGFSWDFTINTCGFNRNEHSDERLVLATENCG